MVEIHLVFILCILIGIAVIITTYQLKNIHNTQIELLASLLAISDALSIEKNNEFLKRYEYHLDNIYKNK